MMKNSKVRSIVIAIVVGLVFICTYAILSAINKPPEMSIDFCTGTLQGEVISLHDIAQGKGAALIFIDPEVEGSQIVLHKIMETFEPERILAVSVSELSQQEQLALLPDDIKALPNLSFDGAEAIEKYNIGNAPVTYFLDSELYVVNAFIGDIKQETIVKYEKRLLK
jgi:hypothetical protein